MTIVIEIIMLFIMILMMIIMIMIIIIAIITRHLSPMSIGVGSRQEVGGKNLHPRSGGGADSDRSLNHTFNKKIHKTNEDKI